MELCPNVSGFVYLLRPNLPITEAVMQETLRVGCIAPLSVPHHADVDIPILGGKLVIPAGTTVMPNLSYIVNNPRVFPDPEKFNPERFLDSQGKYVKNEQNIIFGTGIVSFLDHTQSIKFYCNEESQLRGLLC